MARDKLTQHQKYESFAKAFGTLDTHLKNGNFIAAYVIGFSILEDRLKALYYARKRQSGQQVKGYVNHYSKIDYLLSSGDISTEEAENWKAEGDRRNDKIHAAMWNINEFSRKNCEEILKLAREADSARRKQKKELDK